MFVVRVCMLHGYCFFLWICVMLVECRVSLLSYVVGVGCVC